MAAPISSICRARTARSPRRWSRPCSAQDYVSGLFVDDDLGSYPRHAAAVRHQPEGLGGDAACRRSSINFRSFATGCDKPVMCTVEIADTGLQQGQGMHGSFSRADTMNFMAAIGPDFKAGFVDEAPVSNADIGKTMAHILGLKIPFKGTLMGRVVEEALPGGASPVVENFIERSHAGSRRPRHHPGRPARRRERAISTPPGSPAAPSAWTSAKRPAADQGWRQQRNTLSSAAARRQSFMLRRAASLHDCPLCRRAYSARARTPILTPANVIDRILRRIVMALAIGDTAPDFEAETTEGKIRFHDWLGNSWGVLFSHPKDFTPICTTELGTMARMKPEFDKRNTKIIGLSVDPVDNHKKWAVDIKDVVGFAPNYPMIGDTDLKISKAYGMLPAASTAAPAEGRTPADNMTVRNVFIVGPDKKIKLILVYPMTTGRNFDEILRVLDSLQLTAKHRMATPANWKQGEDVLMTGAITEDEAKKLYPGGWKTPKPYIRIVPQPK